jgi:hypothetical protein
VGDVAGVDQEGWSVRGRSHMIQCLLECSGDVGVDRLVETEMTVADLGKCEAGLRCLGLSYQAGGDDLGPWNAAGDAPDHRTSGPGHAFQESAPVLALFVLARVSGVVFVCAHARAPSWPDLDDQACPHYRAGASDIPEAKKDFSPGIKFRRQE